MFHRFHLVMGVLLLLATPSRADQVGDELNHVKLWNDCRPMLLGVEDIYSDSEDGNAVSLAKETVEIAVRSRLRAARLYEENFTPLSSSFLYISVHIVNVAVNIRIQYYKLVLDLATDRNLAAATWQTSITGHGMNSNSILQQLSQLVDKFIDEYLRINADACGSSRVDE